MEDKEIAVYIRLPKALHDKLVKKALEDRRSMAKQMVWMLEKALEVK